MRVIIVGAGGIGSHIAEPVARTLEHGEDKGPHLLLIVDGDGVEEKNLARQSFKAEDVGAFKAEALAKNLTEKNFSNVDIAYIEEYVNAENISELLEEGDIIISCVDNHRTRKILCEWVEKNLSTCVLISAGNELTTGNAQMFVRYGGVNVTGNLFQNHPEIETPPDDDKHPDDISCEEKIQEGGRQAEQTIRANIFAATVSLGMLGQAVDWMRNPKEYKEPLSQEISFNINGSSQQEVIVNNPSEAIAK